jgi:lysozyme family protein
MKNLKVIYGAILLSICGGIIVRTEWKTCKKQSGISNDYKKKYKIMGNINNANIDYILRWEGGLSKHSKDSASANCVPDGSGYHTNKGIQWVVFKAQFGDSPEAIKRFYEMSKEDWMQVYKLYWEGIKADDIESDLIAEFWADFAWGSGVYGAAKQLQKFIVSEGFNIAVDGKVGKQTLSALNRLIIMKGEDYIYLKSYDHRVDFLRGLDSFKHFGRGWISRLKDFHKYALSKLNG